MSSNDTAPRVSVVIPTFNRADLLPETLDSILSQEFDDFEVIVIDDGSTDHTAEVIAAYGDRIVYRHHANVGEAASVNRGWSLARGEYVAIVSSDDPMLPGWLHGTVGALDASPDVLVAYPDWRIIDGDSKTVSKVETIEYSYRKMVSWIYTIPGPGALIRRQAVAGMQVRNPAYRYISDLEFWMRAGLRGPFVRVPRELATWRSHATSITVADRSIARAREFIRLVDDFFARSDLAPETRSWEREARSRAYWYASWVLEDTHPFLSAAYRRKSYRLVPTDAPDLRPGLNRWPCPTLRDLGSALLAEIRQFGRARR